MIIAIDPSINETGWACQGIKGEISSGVIKTIGNTEAKKIQDLCTQLGGALTNIQTGTGECFTEVVIEVAEGFTYARSADRQGKAKNAGSMYKNGMAVGAIIALFGIMQVQVIQVGATAWKGKLGKKHSMAYMGKSNHNEADALMLLRWYLAGLRGRGTRCYR
ncbi:MAG TPA: hypothetical protein ENG95_05600 [Nitrospirae bacterium]|nr:hypothetical protein [Nitrospirota bacterium]